MGLESITQYSALIQIILKYISSVTEKFKTEKTNFDIFTVTMLTIRFNKNILGDCQENKKKRRNSHILL